MVELTFQAKIIEQHRITIPKTTREILKINIGDTVTINIKKCGE